MWKTNGIIDAFNRVAVTNATLNGRPGHNRQSRRGLQPWRSALQDFWSTNAARATVSFLTMDKLNEIIHWIQGTDARVVVEGAVPAASSIGYIVTENSMVHSNRARMVLQRLPSSEVFGIVTAFPIR